MSTWQVVTAANLFVAAAYAAISFIVIRGLAKTRQLRSNPLGLATGLIFLTCAVHHGSHSLHMLLPSLGVQDAHALAMREAWHWPSAGWDIFSALVAIFYLSLREKYAGLLATAGMFEDMRARERQALEINDNIVQGLARVKWALETRRDGEAQTAADRTLAEAQKMVTDLLMAQSPDGVLQAGRLRRATPAGVAPAVIGSPE